MPLQFPEIKANKYLADYFDLLARCLDEGLMCHHFHDAKQQELFILLRVFYPPEEIYNLLRSVIGREVGFKDFVLRHYTEIPDVKSFASQARMTLATFQRKFKQEFGRPVSQWLIERRAERLLRELRNTNKDFSTIAVEMRFSSLSYMSAFCKRHFGMPPSGVRYAPSVSFHRLAPFDDRPHVAGIPK